MTTGRRTARECAIEALYQSDLIGDSSDEALAAVIERRHPQRRVGEYLARLFAQTVANQDQIDLVLTRTLEKWKLPRLSYVDRAILRMACCEILYFDDIPANVSINEAVELAKYYGDDKSGQFVNGVLDAIAKNRPKSA
jgi:N utilization substance protein B